VTATSCGVSSLIGRAAQRGPEVLLALTLVCGLALVTAPGLLRAQSARLAPAEWARICRLALLTGWIGVEVALIGQAAPTVLRFFGASPLANACEKMVGGWVAGGPTVGWAAATIAVAMPVLAGVGAVRTRRTWGTVHLESTLGTHEEFEGFDLLVLSTETFIAYSVTHEGQNQIVVSDGLLCTLDDPSRHLVLAHEAAHLRHGHHRFLMLATCIEHGFGGAWPVRASTGAMRSALERWADDEAAGVATPERRRLRTALIAVATLTGPDVVASLWGPTTIFERLVALDDAPACPSLIRRGVFYAPFVTVSLLGVAALGMWLGEMPRIIAMASCPI